MNTMSDIAIQKAHAAELSRVAPALNSLGDGAIPTFLRSLMTMQKGQIGGFDYNAVQDGYDRGPIAKANAISRAFRKNTRAYAFPTVSELMKSQPELAKAGPIDVGTLTNFAQVTGGQALGHFSLDTQMARGTVKPSSFTLYQALNKTPANQIVDFWGVATETGGALPGSAFASYSSVSSGSLTPSSGQYELDYTTLKLMLDSRAITMALAAQNSYVNVGETENANAALTLLQTADWALYWGNPTLYANQYQGIAGLIPSGNVIDFQAFSAATSSKGWSAEQTLFNLIYEQAATITTWRQFGRITHAFMSPTALGSLQSLVTTQLQQFVGSTVSQPQGTIVVNGNLHGIETRFGPVQFPLDLFISARNTPAAGTIYKDGTTGATTSLPTPTSAVGATGSATAGSAFTTAYAGEYTYAVAACDSSMNESVPVYSAAVTGVVSGGSVALTITPSNNVAVAFRVYRSGLGYTGTDPRQFRWIGDIAANGSTAVVFTDLNTQIPGSETIFLLDLDDDDMALDMRYLLPLTMVQLYAQSLFTPWAVAAIMAPRVRIPKFHGLIKNYTATTASWNPLVANNPVLPAGG